MAAGRTDSGVHARGQALHFGLPTAQVVQPRGWDQEPGRLEAFLNRQLLPPDVRVWNVSRAPPPAPKNLAVRGEWHAMYNAGTCCVWRVCGGGDGGFIARPANE